MKRALEVGAPKQPEKKIVIKQAKADEKKPKPTVRAVRQIEPAPAAEEVQQPK